eukprot:CAMPEP_0170543310 /NCGR_PEP_ID=MMETSP0211-20121228/2467_1 /TAXON_ID=311385 /ORGANISM="Pseudokeronopsis sp., Strain OXSARD2" /LENGTH=35 /DNA_ID= /DNA_START= /DNA_END= /DNA_ORIENTATION=
MGKRDSGYMKNLKDLIKLFPTIQELKIVFKQYQLG